MVLKSGKASIWVRNIQLAVIGICVARLEFIYRDGSRIYNGGNSRESDSLLVYFLSLGSVFIYAAGGLIDTVVVKHAGSVIKNFATSIGYILCVFAQIILFGYGSIDASFVGGSATVLGAICLFGCNMPAQAVPEKTEQTEPSVSSDPLLPQENMHDFVQPQPQAGAEMLPVQVKSKDKQQENAGRSKSRSKSRSKRL
jgi:hypothetical protein